MAKAHRAAYPYTLRRVAGGVGSRQRRAMRRQRGDSREMRRALDDSHQYPTLSYQLRGRSGRDPHSACRTLSQGSGSLEQCPWQQNRSIHDGADNSGTEALHDHRDSDMAAVRFATRYVPGAGAGRRCSPRRSRWTDGTHRTSWRPVRRGGRTDRNRAARLGGGQGEPCRAGAARRCGRQQDRAAVAHIQFIGAGGEVRATLGGIAEKMIPLLPCASPDETLDFIERWGSK
jgi:hypothetical protein